MVKISVIVPVYRTAKYLKRCFDSILNQTFQDFEIIIVSDGPDEDDSICEEYYKKFPDKITRYVKGVDKGLGGARNAGIDLAQGEYISFIDSDDWIAQNTFEICIEKFTTTEADLVVFNVNITGTGLLANRKFELEYLRTKYSGLVEKQEEHIFNTNVSAWNKLYKRSIINLYNIRFSENLQYEDFPFFYTYMLVCNKIYYVTDKLYNYFRHESCGMNKTYSGEFNVVKDHIAGLQVLYDLLKQNNLYTKNQNIFEKIVLLYVQLAFTNCKNLIDKIKMKAFAKNILQNFDIDNSQIDKYMNKSIFKQFIQEIFSLTNDNQNNNKIIKLLGLKIAFHNK